MPTVVRIGLAKFLLFCLAIAIFSTAFCGRARAVTCDDSKGAHLPTGDMNTDLAATGPCEVKAGTYTFHSVNIYSAPSAPSGGSLTFDDAQITFYAENIVVESGGSLIAGSPSTPIGTSGGQVTIHLWGKPSDPGVTCVSTNCGVPSPPSGTNTRSPNPASCTMSKLPGNVNDCFYDYDTLDNGDVAGAYFGHKVLALAYGGVIQLFGKKGATYASQSLTGCQESSPSCTGTSWVRLSKNALPKDMEIQVSGAVDWQTGDNIVLTTTDYLPDHSEQLNIASPGPTVSGNVTTIPLTSAIQWPHNGQTFDVSTASYPDISRLGLSFKTAETRAAVGLLSHSIQIVSDGDTPGSTFAVNPGNPDNYFGGHTIVRQGFLTYQVQGVEFYQLGQGGSIMHYPVHFHMVRQTPTSNGASEPLTFVKDSSVWDSMTRFMVIHATQGVRLARNVGYESIGHGFYLEDGTETGNQLYANLGVFARAAVSNGPNSTVANPQNPRMVPGILTTNDPSCKSHTILPTPKPPAPPPAQDCALGYDNFPYFSDSNHPAVFWIMNGMNDFEYNMAAGAATCGACYWFVPGAISGPSQMEKWFGYAGEQLASGTGPGSTPLQTFLGNSCSTAMEAFMEVGNSATCLGVNFIYPTTLKTPTSTLVMLPSPKAPPLGDTMYFPTVGGGGRLATRCSAVDTNPTNPTADCSNIQVCTPGDETNCDVVVLDAFTTAFTWAETNFAAIWVRPFWSLVINSVIADVQNAGINFVTSGGYDTASVPTGFWALGRKNEFIGSTQWQNPNNSALSDNPFASNAGPFNPFVSKSGMKGLVCAPSPSPTFANVSNNAYCMSQNDEMDIQLSNFSDFQRFFSVYDGPTYQDSNAFLNIHPTFLTSNGTATGDVLKDAAGHKCEPSDSNGNPCQSVGFASAGLEGLRAYKPESDTAGNRCYFPSAAIGWKQPNGFYYAPAFHSVNLFFSGVDIRHFVTEPFFTPGLKSFATDVDATKKDYCFWDGGTFTGFTDIDRETVLNDDDGTLTGLTSPLTGPSPIATPTPAAGETISVNKENFFKAPTEAWECASDFTSNKMSNPRCLPATAKTSPYEYVSAAIYPECALTAPPIPLSGLSLCTDGNWGSSCTNSPPSLNGCLGVPIYRQLLKSGETSGLDQVKRMMGQNNWQRSTHRQSRRLLYSDHRHERSCSLPKSECVCCRQCLRFVLPLY